MTAHSQLSPSRRHRWKRCAGSIREEAKYPEKFSASAVDGTHTHTLIERCVLQNLDDPMNWIGIEIVDHEGAFTVDADRAARAKVCIEYIKQRVADNPGAVVVSETRVEPAPLVGRFDMSGTVDITIYYSDGTAELIDYKDGMGQVDAFENDQLEQYGLGVVCGSTPVSKLRMTIVQPKLAFRGLPAITSHDVNAADLLAKVPQIIAEAAATDAPDAPLTPGDVQCKFCRAKGGCAALANNVMKEVGVMFPKVTDVMDISQQSADKDPATMSDDQIRQIIEAAPLMRQLLESVEAEALRRLQSGTSIPGLKLVNGRGSRSWNLAEDQIAEKLIKMGIPKSSVYETKLVSPAKVEKLTWKNRKDEVKQLSPRQLKTIEQEYVAKMAGKLTVALESDARQSVVTNASSLFSAVPAPADALPAWLS
ncbi:MAG: DUF2800 domain-containing protein [Patescibacteria group bacterium]